MFKLIIETDEPLLEGILREVRDAKGYHKAERIILYEHLQQLITDAVSAWLKYKENEKEAESGKKQ